MPPMNRPFRFVMPAVFKRGAGERSGFPLRNCGNDEGKDRSRWFIGLTEPSRATRGLTVNGKKSLESGWGCARAERVDAAGGVFQRLLKRSQE